MNKIEKLLDGVDVEWMFLGDIAEIYGGLTGKSKADFENGNAGYISYKSIFSKIAITESPIDFVSVNSKENQHEVQYGDVLFTRSSETADEAGMSSAITVKFEEPVYLNSFSFGVRFNDRTHLMPEFSKYLFRTNSMRSEIAKTASGVTRFNISNARFRKLLIPIPCPNAPEKSLAIQSAIVAILDTFDALVNDISAGRPTEIAARRKQYDYYREKLLTFKKKD